MTDGTDNSLEALFNNPIESQVDEAEGEAYEAPPAEVEQPEIQDDTGEISAPPVEKQGDPIAAFKAKALDEGRKRQAAELRIQQLEAERNQWMQSQSQNQQKPAPEVKAPTTPDQFDTYEGYLSAIADERATAKANEIFEKYAKTQEEQQQKYQLDTQTAKDVSSMAQVGSEKYPDFAQVVGNQGVQITDHMMNSLLAIDNGHDVAYQLGMNPQVSAQIANLPPSSQARAIGEIARNMRASSEVPKPTPVVQPVIPKTLTQTRSASGQYTGKPWTGPTALDQVFSKKY